MLVEPYMIRSVKVTTKDKETLGTAVNILFSTDSEGLFGDAYILVFPNLTNPLLKEAIESSIETIKAGIDEAAPDINVIDKGLDEGSSIVKNYQERKEKQKLSMFYLIPLNQVAQADKEKIQLTIDSIQIKDYVYMDTQAIPEKSMVFYRAMAPDQGRLWTNTLNLRPIQGFIVSDSLGTKGKVESIIIDSEQSIATALTIRTVGATAAKHIVALIDFDFETMSNKKAFKK